MGGRRGSGIAALSLAAIMGGALVALPACGKLAKLDSDTDVHRPAKGTGEVAPDDLTAQVEQVRVVDAAAPGAPACFEATLSGEGLSAATILTPKGETLALASDVPIPADEQARPGTTLAVRVDLPETALLERFPPGTYALEARLLDGSRRTLAVVLEGAFPAAPTVLVPEDGASAVPVDPRFEWSGDDVRYDVDLVDEGTGARTRLVDDTLAHSALPPSPLRAGASYRLEVTAEDGPPGELVEHETVRIIRFSTAKE